MPTTEMKRLVFLKLRAENYRASLRLEGVQPRAVSADKSVYGLLLVCKHSVFDFEVRLLTYIRSLTALPLQRQGP